MTWLNSTPMRRMKPYVQIKPIRSIVSVIPHSSSVVLGDRPHGSDRHVNELVVKFQFDRCDRGSSRMEVTEHAANQPLISSQPHNNSRQSNRSFRLRCPINERQAAIIAAVYTIVSIANSPAC